MRVIRQPRKIQPRPAPSPSLIDRADYDKQIDALTKFAYDEYRQVGLDRPKMQLGLVRTYLWVASASLALQGAVIQKLLGTDILNLKLIIDPYTYVEACIAIIACLMAFWAFVMGIDTMRGRHDGVLPFGKFLETATMIHTSCFNPQTNIAESRISILQGFDNAINHYNIENIQRAKKLRSMSRWLLCSSFLFVLFMVLHFLYIVIIKEVI